MPSVSADHDVSITDDMKFNPEDLTINVGDAVTWTNNDGMGHTATSTDGPVSFDSGNIAAGATWSFTFTETGTYDYKCNYHSSMTATITVVEPDNDDEENDTEDELPRTDSDWFKWTINGTHHSTLAVTNESLNWTHVIVSIYNDTGVYQQPSHAFVYYIENEPHMNLTFLENGTHYANITLYNNEGVLAYHNWTFLIEEDSENEEEETDDSSDSDNDGISDDNDLCPEEDASGHDANADGCIDDSDDDGIKNNVDECPFDATNTCDATLQNQENFCPDEITDENKDTVDDSCMATFDESEEYEPEEGLLSSISFFGSICVMVIIAFRRKNEN